MLRHRLFHVIIAVLTAVVTLYSFQPLVSLPGYAQNDCQSFPQTGQTVCGGFLQYWNQNGGLAQQGYPISGVMSEKSDTDGKIYTVQYFERAVFEAHPENQAPYDVLLSLLGSMLYVQKYPSGAPNQTPNTGAGPGGSQLFPQTGKYVGGVFLTYWQQHGGLAQQGLPISDEFIETSATDGKQYEVQYFERAVFEHHPENAGTPYEVLLSQLGTFKLRQEQQIALTPTLPSSTSTPLPSSPTPIQTAAPPTATVLPAGTLDCSGIPPSQSVTSNPTCGPYGTGFHFSAAGFQAGEAVTVFVSRPNGTHGDAYTDTADATGTDTQSTLRILTPLPGVWGITFVGVSSGKTDVGYFKVTGPDNSACKDGPPPPSQDASVSPACGTRGYTTFRFAAIGFTPGETVGVYFTDPNQVVYDARFQVTADADGYTVGTYYLFYDKPSNVPGVWVATFEGVQSHVTRTAYFKLYKP